MTFKPRFRPFRDLAAVAAILAAAYAAAPAIAQQSSAAAPVAMGVDFDAAMRGLNFAPATLDGNLDATMAGNG
ncbi:MAG: hypothetical protein KBF30_09155, partial [Hyphomonadaceae bacterium]|nr:hypothetical protein [Hyphomonadaceae bacterium]